MTATIIFAGLASYIVVAVLVLSIGVTSLWRWWVKLAALAMVGVLFGASYYAVVGMLGWPNPYGSLPVRFKLIWSSVVEPDRLSASPGLVYLWVEEMDGNNVPSDTPRSFQLAYTEDFANVVRAAQQRRNDGEQIMGELHYEVFADPFGDTQLVEPGQEIEPPEAPQLTVTFRELPPELTSGSGG